MTFKVLILAHRLPGVSLDYFRQRYTRHMNMVQEMTGTNFPLIHTRRYIHRPDGENAAVLQGSQDDFDYDCLVEMVFESEEVYKAFAGTVSTGENAKKIDEDEKGFFDRQRVKVVVLGDTDVTERKA
jgi:hypothetical protein